MISHSIRTMRLLEDRVSGDVLWEVANALADAYEEGLLDEDTHAWFVQAGRKEFLVACGVFE